MGAVGRIQAYSQVRVRMKKGLPLLPKSRAGCAPSQVLPSSTKMLVPIFRRRLAPFGMNSRSSLSTWAAFGERALTQRDAGAGLTSFACETAA